MAWDLLSYDARRFRGSPGGTNPNSVRRRLRLTRTFMMMPGSCPPGSPVPPSHTTS